MMVDKNEEFAVAVIDDGRSKLDGHSRVEGLNICIYGRMMFALYMYVCMYVHT